MPLESDTANADALLQVEFYEYKGEGPHLGKPFVRIIAPGDKTNIYDQPAREFDKRRFQLQWLNFQARNNDGARVIGIPLIQWRQERPEELTEGQLAELTILSFMTVEQLAMASDGQIMRVGMGGVGLRDRARSYLSSKNAAASGADLAKAQDEILMLKASMERLLAAQSQPMSGPKEKTYKAGAARRSGWPKGKPRKQKVPVNVHHDNAPVGATGS